jgi:hypothetical protein
MNTNINSVNFSHSGFVYNDERFEKLSQKISLIQNFELKNPNKFSHLENKVDHFETNVSRSLKDFEFKYKFLQDELSLLSKNIEDLNESKENLKSKINIELKNAEGKIKNLFEIERENSKSFSDNLFKTIENDIFKLYNKQKKERSQIIQSVQNMKTVAEVDMPKLNQKISECTQERETQIKNLVQSMNEEFKYFESLV